MADSSMGLLCLGGPQPGHLTLFPWDRSNLANAYSTYMTTEITSDPETGLEVDGYLLFGGGGASMHGCSPEDGCSDLECGPGELAFITGGKLKKGRDGTLVVNIPPPGGFYYEITGPSGGVKAAAITSACVQSDGNIISDSWSPKTDSVYYTGIGCAVYYHTETPDTGVAFSSVCTSGQWYAVSKDDNSTTHESAPCLLGSLMITDLVGVTEVDQPYTSSGPTGWHPGKEAMQQRNRHFVKNLAFNERALFQFAADYCDQSVPIPGDISYRGVGGDCSHFLAHMLAAGGLRITNANFGRNCPLGLIHSNYEMQLAFLKMGPTNAQPIYSTLATLRGDVAFLYTNGRGVPYHGMILAGPIFPEGGQNCAAVYCHTSDRCGEKLCSPNLVPPFYRISPGVPPRTIIVKTP